MFANISNASKAAFIWSVEQLMGEGVRLIDCQVETPHLVSLGAELIDRRTFQQMLERWIER
jgi:leucyl/phenylalanyl-tRNA--protein transferase